MFPASYYSKAYFAGNYWPPTGVISKIYVSVRYVFRKIKTTVLFRMIEVR